MFCPPVCLDVTFQPVVVRSFRSNREEHIKEGGKMVDFAGPRREVGASAAGEVRV